MTLKNRITKSMAALVALTVLGMAIPAFAEPSGTALQRRPGGGGGGGGGGQRQEAPQRQAPQRQAPAPQVHARREGVRTPNYVSRTPAGGYEKAAPIRQPDRTPPSRIRNQSQPAPRSAIRQAPARVQADRKFTKTNQGRHYDNGLNLRKGVAVKFGWQKRYFPHGYVHFPFYRQRYDSRSCFYSPFSFFFGICCPFIDISVCAVYPPSVDFIDMPVYSGTSWSGYANADSDNMINDPSLDQNDPGLNGALDELTETFQAGNIDGLASLVSPNVSIAIFLKGRYQYTLTSSNYVDLTRDAISAMTNTQLNLTYLHQRSPGVFCVSGSQTYTASDGSSRIVYMSFVLQDISGQWTLTQVGTSPDVIQSIPPTG